MREKQGEGGGIRSENTQANVLAFGTLWLNDLGVSRLSSSNLSAPICKMGASLPVLIYSEVILFLPLTFHVQLFGKS